MNRQDIIQLYKENTEISVLIVGAGINGIGTFRDLALQGVDVLMIDKGDFCSGASAASSHMVHGGIRYLENGEFRLVREAVQERNRLLENAPHYVKPLPTVIPIFHWFSGLLNAPLKFLRLLNKPSERGALVIKIGLMFYDAFTRKQATVPKHKFRSQKATLAEFPDINPKVRFTARYYDGAMRSPERICVELMLDGEAANANAHALNYVSLQSASLDTVTLRDELTGETFSIQPKIVINAAGPWIDFANAKLSQQTQYIGGTKGSHLVLDNAELRKSIGENEFFFENSDGRIVLILPLMDKVMIGTSDLPIDNPDDVRCSEAEIDYFFKMVPVIFPGIHLNNEQIVFRFSGVRPLPFSDTASTGQISRDHSIRVIEPGNGVNFPVYCLVGGKWTSFRAFSEEVVEKTLGYLNHSRTTGTRYLPIGGGRDYPDDSAAREEWIEALANQSGLSTKKVGTLFDRYGTRAKPIVEYIAHGANIQLKYLPDYSRLEIKYLTMTEKVVHLDDFFLRRSMIAKLGQLTGANVHEIAKIVGKVLGWSDDRLDEEIQRTHKIFMEKHGVILEQDYKERKISG